MAKTKITTKSIITNTFIKRLSTQPTDIQERIILYLKNDNVMRDLTEMLRRESEENDLLREDIMRKSIQIEHLSNELAEVTTSLMFMRRELRRLHRSNQRIRTTMTEMTSEVRRHLNFEDLTSSDDSE